MSEIIGDDEVFEDPWKWDDDEEEGTARGPRSHDVTVTPRSTRFPATDGMPAAAG